MQRGATYTSRTAFQAASALGVQGVGKFRWVGVGDGEIAQMTAQHPHATRMTSEEIRAVINSLGGMQTVIRNAAPVDKHEVYRSLDLRLTYDDQTRTVLVESRPAPPMCVLEVSEGGHNHYARTMTQPLQKLVVL